MECCSLNPPERRFCCTCGSLLRSKGVLRNPERGWEYQVIDILGEGGMSNTYLVYNPQIQRLSILKEIHSDLERKAKIRELFLREARVLQSLKHVGVPCFHDFFCADDHYSLVMEVIHGPTLEKVEPPSPSQAVGWMMETCAVLSYLHERTPPVIHRDIKPANLILRYSPRRIVLIDYGAVKEVGSQQGTRIATFGYGAPEQQIGRPSIQSDFYGVGTTLIYLLTRRFPGDFYLPRERRFAGLEQAGVDPGLAQVIYRLTHYIPQERGRDAQEVAALLEPHCV
ncbi:serine/threonine protein kinase [Anthocerotibacter panamensis]|uniref:serine/threonine protein kinase n=1 Tax=Anthocerotibacter panamensis TaxID=2857077 RepID=UPI001C406547|nr:serine/threonine-protein kinase [Anthocerotibacter panamensis]